MITPDVFGVALIRETNEGATVKPWALGQFHAMPRLRWVATRVARRYP